jgi:hypothetical protein
VCCWGGRGRGIADLSLLCALTDDVKRWKGQGSVSLGTDYWDSGNEAPLMELVRISDGAEDQCGTGDNRVEKVCGRLCASFIIKEKANDIGGNTCWLATYCIHDTLL